jgi:hypothetical protein
MRTRAYSVLFCLAIAGCGGGADGGDGGDDPSDDADGGDGDGDGGDGGDTGGDGDTGDDGGQTFAVGGSVVDGAALRRAVPGVAPRVVDHVVAVAPSSNSQRRAYSTVGSDGSFALDIDTAHAWVLVFVDSTRVGADMIAGVLGAGSLDTLTPTANGDSGVDLGEVEVDASGSGEATAALGYDELIDALGLDPDAADYLGAIDDLCLRYVNPDIDANGVLDVLEPEDHRFLLDFHVGRNMVEDGLQATVADLVGRFLDPAITTSSFIGTGIYFSAPQAFWDGPLSEATLTFAGDLHYLSFDPEGEPSGTLTAGTPIGGGALIENDFGDMRSVGVYAAPGFDMPQDEYEADLGERHLTFTNVATLADVDLATAEGTLLPFVRFAPADPECAEACTIAAIDVEWRKSTGEGWILATAAELAVTVSESGGFASMRVGGDQSELSIGVTLPAGAPTASVPWVAAQVFLGGIDEAAFAAVTSDQLCHLGLSYDDRLGMRHFAGIANAPGTCP